MGESREEYVDREMSPYRRRSETAGHLHSYVSHLSELATQPLLVAVDQEPWGIQRLHDMVPSYHDAADYLKLPLPELRENARTVAAAAREFGVSMFLSPVLDVLDGENPWLSGRTLDARSHDAILGPMGAFVAGTQRAGVATVAKHFPGFPRLDADPALVADAAVRLGRWTASSLLPFEAAARGGVAGIMLGPAVVEDLDPDEPASTSDRVVDCLRREVRFGGLVVSDDLDAPATLKGRSLAATMTDSLRAGADLLLVGGGEHLLEIVEAIYQVARADRPFAERVHDAASRVLVTARAFGTAG
jgi:beta-N-acetylhexosaminidase